MRLDAAATVTTPKIDGSLEAQRPGSVDIRQMYSGAMTRQNSLHFWLESKGQPNLVQEGANMAIVASEEYQCNLLLTDHRYYPISVTLRG